ncbi:caspase family protein [Cypionkella sp.]|uniref:caspase family protein n=1 Tax=Cypionkella sp. TaxID=2811411 RepID=UPI002ABB3D33|nr:caspase family protein [Cypionkella sp.]MDZ4392954.1 caspase family protein [Cypionkella sp.]
MTLKAKLRAGIVTIGLGLAAFPALARENYALLIGAAEYQNLDPKYWLRGPANDVRLVQTYLTTASPVPFKPSGVIVLADGIEGAQAPTLAAIRAAVADLTARVQPGDFVYLHFSGHGSQSPALNPETELDGLDETFLPSDIGPWQDEIGTVQNALVDDEIGSMIDGLRAKGADVWAVFDSCHSGTVTRGVEEDDVRLRELSPDALGIPAELMQVSTRALPAAEVPFDEGSQPGMGSFVAFFAAQTNEVTPEKNLPKGKPGRVPQGVFTYTLFEVLAQNPGASYGQIGQEVLRSYATKRLATTTPMFEGDLDRVAFSGQAQDRVAQWTGVVEGEGVSIPAGSLHGLTEGAVLAVMAKATDADAAALGFVTLTAVETFSATAEAVDQALPAELPKGFLLRKIGTDVDFTLTVALPKAGTAPALEAALTALQAASGPRLAYVAAGEEADLRLAVIMDSPRPGAIWVLPATGLVADFAATPSVSTADKDAAELGEVLADTLTTMARAINLQKLGAAVGSGSLNVEVELLTGKDKSSLQVAKAAEVPRLVPEDQVHILARNNMDQPVDINVLYIAADYAISHWFSGRLQPGDVLKKGLFKIGADVLGDERMIVVMTPALPQSPVEDLSFLAQDALDTTRSLGGSSLSVALSEAGFGQTTRSATALEDDTEGPAAGMIALELRTGLAK